VLYTTERGVTIEAANRSIKTAGLTNLSFIDWIEPVEAIPMLGSGKTNHRGLKAPAEILEDRPSTVQRATAG
jgi:hypothetical protein